MDYCGSIKLNIDSFGPVLGEVTLTLSLLNLYNITIKPGMFINIYIVSLKKSSQAIMTTTMMMIMIQQV